MKFRFTALIAIVAAGLVLQASGLFAEETSHDPKSLGYIKGFSWGWTGWRGSYAAPEAEESLGKLADTGTEWVCIAFAPNMQTFDTPEFLFGDANPDMITDAELRRTIDVARAKGLKPMLKPVVNSADDVWRAWIRFFRPITAEERAAGITGEHDPYGESPKFREGEVKDLAKWDQWWDDYTNYIVHYAKIAEEKQVPVLCLGCEMNSTEEFADKWRNLIAKVRDVYHGQITYDVNHGNEEKVAWFDALDFISLSAYYPIPGADGQVKETPSAETTSVEEIRAAMLPVRDHLAKVSAKWGKPILFIEAGVTPVRGCAGRLGCMLTNVRIGRTTSRSKRISIRRCSKRFRTSRGLWVGVGGTGRPSFTTNRLPPTIAASVFTARRRRGCSASGMRSREVWQRRSERRSRTKNAGPGRLTARPCDH